jgi:hypothetical protein
MAEIIAVLTRVGRSRHDVVFATFVLSRIPGTRSSIRRRFRRPRSRHLQPIAEHFQPIAEHLQPIADHSAVRKASSPARRGRRQARPASSALPYLRPGRQDTDGTLGEGAATRGVPLDVFTADSRRHAPA